MLPNLQDQLDKILFACECGGNTFLSVERLDQAGDVPWRLSFYAIEPTPSLFQCLRWWWHHRKMWGFDVELGKEDVKHLIERLNKWLK